MSNTSIQTIKITLIHLFMVSLKWIVRNIIDKIASEVSGC